MLGSPTTSCCFLDVSNSPGEYRFPSPLKPGREGRIKRPDYIMIACAQPVRARPQALIGRYKTPLQGIELNLVTSKRLTIQESKHPNTKTRPKSPKTTSSRLLVRALSTIIVENRCPPKTNAMASLKFNLSKGLVPRVSCQPIRLVQEKHSNPSIPILHALNRLKPEAEYNTPTNRQHEAGDLSIVSPGWIIGCPIPNLLADLGLKHRVAIVCLVQ